MSNAWNQLEQLLTCCICLDRYRQPKLLPCQHSFCEPCLDGLVDYVRKQIKCPECRAEHRLPYTGDPNFPVNFTLMRFLELYQRLTGEEVEPLPSMLERCTVCSEKAEVTLCAHCDKKVCEECKNAHIQIMQRELQRLNSQIRRALSRFNEELGQLKKCDDKLRFGCEQARSSIVDLAASLVCLIKEKEKQLLKELEDFEQSEESNLKKLREGLDEEYNNQVANCELIEKNVLNYSPSRQVNQSNLNLSVLEDDDSSNELIQWSDLELVEFRELFLKMLEFLRNFETLDGMEYARSALKLDVIKDLDNVRKQAANYASLKIQYMATEKLQLQQQMVAQLAAGMPIQAAGSPNYAQPLGSTHALNQAGTGQLNVPLQQSILMRSQSDHRLATQFAKKELLQKQQGGSPSGKYGTGNYGEHDMNNQYGSATTGHYAPGQASTQYRSRFMREKNAELSAMHDSDESYDPYAAHRVRFGAEEGMQQLNPVQLAAQLQSALKVFDTKDASRCPLSSIVKLNESSHFMERIDENKRKAKKLEKEKAETKAMSQPPIQHSSVGQSNPIQQPINPSLQHANLTNRQSPIQQHGGMTGNTVAPQQQQQQLGQNKAPPPNRQMSEDEIDKQKRLNKQWELQSLNSSALADVTNTTVNSAPVQQLVSQQSQQSAPRQPLQKQNSIHGPEPSMPTSQLAGQNKLVSKSLLSSGVGSVQQPPHSRLNQTSSGPDDEEDEEIEDSVEEDSDEDDDDSALPGNARSLRNQTMAKNHISLAAEKKKEITKRPATKTMQTNPIATSTATTSSANRTTASRLAGRPVKTEASKLTLEQSNSANNARRIRPNKDSKLMSSLSSEEKKATGPRSSAAIAATAAAASPATDSSSAASSSTQSSSTLARKDTNGEFLRNNRAKSFTPITLTSGSQLAAVLAQHKKIAAVGYQPDHAMLQKTIEVGTSKVGHLNGPASTHNDHPSLTGSHPNSQNNAHTNAKSKFLTNQTKNKRFAARQSPEKVQATVDENNNNISEPLTAEERKRQLYLRSPFLAQALDGSKPAPTLDEYNKRILFGTDDANDSFDLGGKTRSEMPDSVADLLTRSAKAREPLAKPLNKQLIAKRKAGQIKQDSLDSGTSSPTSRSIADLKYGSPAKSANKLATRNDFARTYALSSSQSPSITDRSASEQNSAAAAGLVRSNTLTNLNTLAGTQSAGKTATSTGFPTTSNSISLSRRPRSDYANSEEIKYKYRTRVPKKTLNGLLDEEKSASLDTEQLSRNLDDPQSASTSISQLQKQHSLESNLRPNKKDAEPKNRQLRKSRTSGLYMAEGGAFDYLSSSDEEPPIAPIPNKLFDATDQLLYKQKLEQRTELYRNKGAVKLCIGRQGAGTGEFSYPRDVVYAKFTLKTKLVGQQVLMVVDSGNSRIQIFDTQGKYLSEFGQNGTGSGAFDCPSSACCFPEGTIVVSDTNNHRLQFFDSNGRFIRQIGGRPPGAQTPGTGQPPPVFATTFETSGVNLARQTSAEPGQFAFPYGVCYDASQNELYVCDKENGVIQILDGEGNFKRFLSQHRSGRLNAIFRLTFKSPNFVHSNGQQLICSDTNSHCVHVFSLKNSQKRILGEGEGIQEGKFKKPRGVALDEMNFAIVADAGNNRVQIFRPDGSFLKSFGSWGSSNGQFKGIEGIAVDDFGDIYVCDRESGKIQVF